MKTGNETQNMFTVVTLADDRNLIANVVYNEQGEQVYVDTPGSFSERFNKELKRVDLQASSFSNALNLFKGKAVLNEDTLVPFPPRRNMPKTGVVRDKTGGLVTRFELYENDSTSMTRYRMVDQCEPGTPIMTYDTMVKYYELLSK